MSQVSSDTDSPYYAPNSVTLFRDTGTFQTLLLEGTIPISMMTSEDQSVLIRGIGDVYVAILLYRVHLDCKYFKGPIVV